MSYNRGTKYLFAGNYVKALQFFRREELEFKELFLNMGNCYRYLGDDARAVECYLRANREDMPMANGVCSGMYPLALTNLGLIEYAAGRDDDAIALYKKALEISPLHFDAIWNYGNALLRRYFSSNPGLASDWKLGWEMYEYRFKRSGNPVVVDTTIPRWDGVSKVSSIVVLTEQGLGDKIMFGRYISRLKEFADEVYVQCHPSLDVFFSDYKLLRDDVSVAQYSIPLCSLAGYFGLESERWLEGKFKARALDGSLKIGIVWSGSTTHANDRNRSCPVAYFKSLSKYGTLYSLNPGTKCGFATDISSKDWSVTASNLLGLDLLVSVDTSIVHLAGSLGVPTLMLQPLKETDFRWGHGCIDTPWYKSVNIIDNKGWDAVFAELGRILECIKK